MDKPSTTPAQSAEQQLSSSEITTIALSHYAVLQPARDSHMISHDVHQYAALQQASHSYFPATGRLPSHAIAINGIQPGPLDVDADAGDTGIHADGLRILCAMPPSYEMACAMPSAGGQVHANRPDSAAAVTTKRGTTCEIPTVAHLTAPVNGRGAVPALTNRQTRVGGSVARLCDIRPTCSLINR